MSKPIDKSEEQIAKDKEAVKAMTGAKAAMEASLRRIDVLENALESVQRQSETLSKAFGKDAFLNVWQRGGDYKPERISTLFENINNTIKAAL